MEIVFFFCSGVFIIAIFFLHIMYLRKQEISYLLERKMKFLMKRMRENSTKMCAGLCCGSGAGASATLSSVQGVNSQAGMAVFAAAVMPGGVQLGTAAVPHLPKLH